LLPSSGFLLPTLLLGPFAITARLFLPHMLTPLLLFGDDPGVLALPPLGFALKVLGVLRPLPEQFFNGDGLNIRLARRRTLPPLVRRRAGGLAR
jgi:hypothetical protein